jgi:DNA polymerase III subunit epsilon
MVASAPKIRTVMKEASKFVGGVPVVAHNASFDWKFWQADLSGSGIDPGKKFGCTMLTSRRISRKARTTNLAR